MNEPTTPRRNAAGNGAAAIQERTEPLGAGCSDPPARLRASEAVKTTASAVSRRVGARARDRRNDLGLTQRELAAAVGLTRSSIANIEAGRQEFSVANIVAIADALRTTVGALLGEEPQTAAPETRIRQAWQVDCAVCGHVAFALDHEEAREIRTTHVRREHLETPR